MEQVKAGSKKEQTRERILRAAARAIRKYGYEGVGVADVMRQAGLTHGGFYAHFDSRDALLAEAIDRAGRERASIMNHRIGTSRERGCSPLRAIVDVYLIEAHLRDNESGCWVAA